jgi:hypothetical protein
MSVTRRSHLTKCPKEERSEKQSTQSSLVIRKGSETSRGSFSEEALWDGIQDVEIIVAIQLVCDIFEI